MMLGSRLLQLAMKRMVFQRGLHTTPAAMSHGPPGDIFWGFEKAQGRDYVGYGINGMPAYSERLDNPYPSIRFKKNTPEILALREKEKGDWKKLTMDEKKQLYRASFCATFAEFEAPTGHWKLITGGVLLGLSIALWISFGIHKFGIKKHF